MPDAPSLPALRIGTCPSCGHDLVWRLPARERGLDGEIVDLCIAFAHRDGFEPHGRFALVVCQRCGDTRWLVLDLDAHLRRIFAPARGKHCDSCGSDAVRASRPGAPRPGERAWDCLGLTLCDHCGLAVWTVGARHAFVEEAATLVDDGACVCGGPLRRLDPLRARGVRGEAIVPVLLRRRPSVRSEAGHFTLTRCLRCGTARFTAHGLERLRPDPAEGVLPARATAVPPRAGPYR